LNLKKITKGVIEDIIEWNNQLYLIIFY
jgi:hypothetical protein